MSLLENAFEKYRTDGAIPLCHSALEMARKRVLRRAYRTLLIVGYGWAYYRILKLLGNEMIVEQKGVAIDISASVFSPRTRYLHRRHSLNHDVGFLCRIIEHYADRSKEATIIELGAGSGFTACYFSERIDTDLYIAVEANQSLIPVLENTRRLNGAEFETVHRAYSPSSAAVDFHQHSNFLASGTHPRLKSNQPVSVPTVTLGDLCREYDLDEFILFANMEGTEFELLEAELPLLRQKCPLAVIAFHEFAGDVHATLDSLLEHGYEVVDTRGDFYLLATDPIETGSETHR